jgi:methionyl-tRNA synthetase
MSVRSLYVTTPLYYVNARPHLGHAYATILADVVCRYHRQRGDRVKFLTGTDEHGEKIQQSARKENLPPLDFATGISERFREAWKKLDLRFDVFYRTTQPSHYKLVQNALQQLKDRGEIYFAEYEGKYCVGCERFRTDQEWGEDGLCPDHRTPPEHRKESNYYFKMGAYQERLIAYYKANPDIIRPASYLNEVMGFLAQPLEDLCISRPTSRLEWGIPLPFDDKFVTYVWFDALLNYPGGVGYEGLPAGKNPSFDAELWKNSIHFIGKDILKTHAIYWPTMLMALGLDVFRHLHVSGYWLTNGLKMSKSLGNVVEPVATVERFGNDAFRFFLLREMSYGGDANFTWESFVARCNAELANGLGNLASRSLTIAHKSLGAKVPSRASRGPAEAELLKRVHALPEAFAKDFEAARYHIALTAFGDTVKACDQYVNEQKPWALAKEAAAGNAESLKRLEAVLGTLIDSLWTLSVVGDSVLPEGARKLRAALGDAQAEKAPEWSRFNEARAEGTPLGEVPRLYPRLELPKEE